MTQSQLQHHPRSQVIKSGYINTYSELNPKERRQLKYKSLYKIDNPAWDESMVFLSNYFRDYVEANAIVLDAGCGNGNYIVDENRQKISWAVGIDVSEDSITKNICLDEKLVGDLSALPFADNSFDAAISLWVLEHLEFPQKVFAEIYRVLKPGGLFIFATPNKNYLPLVINKLFKIPGFNTFVNKKLYGREEKDIFKTYYRANAKKTLWSLSDSFTIKELRYNFDPSYSSFNTVTYYVTKLLYAVAHSMGLTFLDAHIIGVLEKNK